MAKITIKEIDNEQLYEKVKNELKHPAVESVEKDGAGNVIIMTGWQKFTLKKNEGFLNIAARWAPNRFILIIALAIVGLFLIVPLLVVLYISLFICMKEQKEMRQALTVLLG